MKASERRAWDRAEGYRKRAAKIKRRIEDLQRTLEKVEADGKLAHVSWARTRIRNWPAEKQAIVSQLWPTPVVELAIVEEERQPAIASPE